MKRALVLGLALTACGASMPADVRQAQDAYARAESGPAARLAPADLHVARERLAAAESSYRDNGDDYRTRALAYAATRQAETAEARAGTIAAQIRAENARADVGRLKEEQARTTAAELSAAQQELAVLKGRLAELGRVQREAQATIVTVPSGVLFESQRFELRPSAAAKLEALAHVLADDLPDARVVVVAERGPNGGDEQARLAGDRASAVRDFLIAHGVEASRVDVRAPGAPAAPNGPGPRVEIVVRPAD